MRTLTFVTGVAVGYVLGARAGREKYEQIVAGARSLAGQPAVVAAQSKAKELVDTGTDAVIGKISPSNDAPTVDVPVVDPFVVDEPLDDTFAADAPVVDLPVVDEPLVDIPVAAVPVDVPATDEESDRSTF